MRQREGEFSLFPGLMHGPNVQRACDNGGSVEVQVTSLFSHIDIRMHIFILIFNN